MGWSAAPGSTSARSTARTAPTPIAAAGTPRPSSPSPPASSPTSPASSRPRRRPPSPGSATSGPRPTLMPGSSALIAFAAGVLPNLPGLLHTAPPSLMPGSAALIASPAGVLPTLPGFLKPAAPAAFAWIGDFWAAAYAYAWFIGLAILLPVYAALLWGLRG